ncbi:AAA family ATPase [Cellulomonas cellasea]|uniref:AAA family ATPase n=1 Tax=Cellulomonas cellasea TaxID=43670 RepID=UPI0025A33329|nr:AAA family ATPase [Cellulomonas cellasea]MDM8083317.1 AAA family ATPase [Cellulomonas cellasea]
MSLISRVRVTGGFLDGLDLELSPGLNVIVGPRGAGKTTLLELLRHALALPHGSPTGDRTAFLRHALGAGEVVLDLKTAAGAERLVVDAGGGGRRPDVTADLALMLGQNELEEIADSATRRLALIDLRAGIKSTTQLDVLAQIKKMTARASDLRGHQEELRDLLRQRSSLLEDRQRAQDREAELFEHSSAADLAPQRAKLNVLEKELIRVEANLRGAAALGAAQAEIRGATAPAREVVTRLVDLSVEATIKGEVERLADAIEQSLEEVAAAADRLERLSVGSTARLTQEDLRLRAEAEPVRTNLDQLERGLGAITAELRDLEAQITRLDSVEHDLRELERLERLELAGRQTAQEVLEDASERVFDARNRAARSITEQLDHRVQIAVRHFADTNAYRRTLVELLQGTGLKYNALADSLASATLPSALLRYVEQGDAGGLAESASIPLDRATRIIVALDNREALSSIAAASLMDSVDFRLQDGATVKSAAQLSTGQKCAVTLPIVLTDPERIVILDQPEDHLDNQFLVDRIVTSLVARTNDGAQSIVATHNPNIPVLGGATQVAHLSSDGSQGLVDVKGPFDALPVVQVITTLMEGGRRAFELRARFYADHANE